MLNPGQFVYIPEEKKLGIYLAYTPPEKRFDSNTLFVFVLVGKKGELSDHMVYDLKELVPVTQPDKKSLTKQSLYKGPFYRDNIQNIYSSKEAETNEAAFLEEMLLLIKKPWFKERYQIELEEEKKK